MIKDNFDYLTEAFTELEDVYDINATQKKKKDLNVEDENDISDLKAYLDDIDDIANEDDILTIVDIDADEGEEPEDSQKYIGDVALQCTTCRGIHMCDVEDLVEADISKDEDEAAINDDKENNKETQIIYNIETECPYCHNTTGFWKLGILGDTKLADDETIDVTPEKHNEGQSAEESEEDTGAFDNNINESLKESFAKYAQTDAQEEGIAKLEKAAKKAGVKIRFGTSVGKSPQSVIFDVGYQDNACRVYPNGAVNIYGKKFGDWNDEMFEPSTLNIVDMSKAFNKESTNESLNESRNIHGSAKNKLTEAPEGSDYYNLKTDDEKAAEAREELCNKIESNVVQYSKRLKKLEAAINSFADHDEKAWDTFLSSLEPHELDDTQIIAGDSTAEILFDMEGHYPILGIDYDIVACTPEGLADPGLYNGEDIWDSSYVDNEELDEIEEISSNKVLIDSLFKEAYEKIDAAYKTIGITVESLTEDIEEKAEFDDVTAQGYKIVDKYKNKWNRAYAIAHRESDDTYIVCLGYDATKGTWAQGRYDFKSWQAAIDALRREKGNESLHEITSFEGTNPIGESLKEDKNTTVTDITSILHFYSETDEDYADIDVVTEEELGHDLYYRKLIKSVHEAEMFNYHSDYWGAADTYQKDNVKLMSKLEPYVGKRVTQTVDDGEIEFTLEGILIDKQYNSIYHTVVLASDMTDVNSDSSNIKNESLNKKNFIVEDIDEVAFNDLANKYINEVYKNVDNFKITNGLIDAKSNTLIVEGLLTFKSGKEQTSKFVFTADSITKKGKAKFIGLNEDFCSSKKAFTLQGTLNKGKFIPESFNYNYRAKALKESKQVFGRIETTLKSLNEAKDLSTIEGSMTKVLQDNTDKFKDAVSKDEVFNTVAELFKENNINTQASERLLTNIRHSKDVTGALFCVYNSILYGSNLSKDGTQKFRNRKESLKEAAASATTADGKQVSVSCWDSHTRTYNYEHVELDIEGVGHAEGKYRWMNRPWQRFDYSSAFIEAAEGLGFEKEAKQASESCGFGGIRECVKIFANLISKKDNNVTEAPVDEACAKEEKVDEALVNIDDDDLVDMLVARVKFWTQEPDVIDLFAEMYDNLVGGGVFESGEPFDVKDIVDNDYVNWCTVIEDEDEAKNYNTSLEELQKAWDSGDREVDGKFIEAAKDGKFLIRESLEENKESHKKLSEALRANKKLKEELKLISDIGDYEPWSGAVDTYDKIEAANMLGDLESYLEDIYPDGLTMTELNDILWFDGDSVLADLGISAEEDKDEDIIEDESLEESYSEATIKSNTSDDEIKIKMPMKDMHISEQDNGELTVNIIPADDEEVISEEDAQSELDAMNAKDTETVTNDVPVISTVDQEDTDEDEVVDDKTASEEIKNLDKQELANAQ